MSHVAAVLQGVIEIDKQTKVARAEFGKTVDDYVHGLEVWAWSICLLLALLSHTTTALLDRSPRASLQNALEQRDRARRVDSIDRARRA